MLTHAVQLIPVLIAMGLALVTVSALATLAALLLTEAGLFAVVPSLSLFRQSIDERADRTARTNAVIARAAVLGRMSDGHRRELEDLEQLAAWMHEESQLDARVAPDLAIEQWNRLDRLLALYVKLAIAHRKNADAFRGQDRVELEIQVERLERMQRAAIGRPREWIDRRRTLLERRRETWAMATEEHDLLTHELATIADAVRWMRELCAASSGDTARAEIEQLLASWEANGARLGELAALDIDAEEPIDPTVLALGRELSPPRESWTCQSAIPAPESSIRATDTHILNEGPRRCTMIGSTSS